MSGFVAVAAPSSRPFDDRVLDGAREVLAHRGGDGEGSWRRGGVALEVQMRRVDHLEERDETQPVVSEVGPLAIVADLRLDDREGLAEALGLSGSHRLSDAALVLRAWRAWGTACAGRMEGDFAFVLWDESQRVLFAARDALGARPLVFHRGNGWLACASEIKALLQFPGMPRQVDRVRVGTYLEFLTDEPRRTFFAGIERLPAGHWLAWNGRSLRVERYHAFDPARRLSSRSDDEYAETFRGLFQQAVRARVRGAPPLACLLSGGLDTSSIVATAREVLGGAPIDAYSAVFDEAKECDERDAQAPVVALGRVRHHHFHAERVSPLADWERILWYQDEAAYVGTYYLHWGLFRLAQADGQRVVLDGWGGDSAVGYGFERLPYLALRGHWWTLAKEVRALSQRVERSRRKLIGHLVVRPLRSRLGAIVGRRHRAELAPATRAEFARDSGLCERVIERDRSGARQALSGRDAWHREFSSAHFATGFECLDRAARARGLESRYPFLDRRLLEFCGALPEDERLRDGWPRSILRRALRGTLPAATSQRPWKTNLGAAFINGILRFEGERLQHLVEAPPGPLDEFLDRGVLRGLLERFRARRRPEDALELSKSLGLGLWLDAFHGGRIGAPRSCLVEPREEMQ